MPDLPLFVFSDKKKVDIGGLVSRHFDSWKTWLPYVNTEITQSVWGCLHLLNKLPMLLPPR